MNTVVILTALDCEYRAVRRHLATAEILLHPAGTVFEVGPLADTDGQLALAVTGEGNLTAAILAERAITTFQPTAMLCVGVAGGLKPEVALGDVVVATRVYAVDGGRDHDQGFAVRPRSWGTAHDIEQVARHVARTGQWTGALTRSRTSSSPVVHFKPIASGEVVHQTARSDRARRLRNAYDDAVAVEMESAGVALAAQLNRALPTLAIRAISDRADHTKPATDAAGWQGVAAARAAAFAVAISAVLLHPSNAVRSTPRNRATSKAPSQNWAGNLRVSAPKPEPVAPSF